MCYKKLHFGASFMKNINNLIKCKYRYENINISVQNILNLVRKWQILSQDMTVLCKYRFF